MPTTDVLAYWTGRQIARTREGDVAAWVAALRARTLSTSSIRHRLDRLSALHQLAVTLGYLPRIPCRVGRPRMVALSVRPAISEAHLRKLLAVARKRRDSRAEAILLLAADAGLRLGEIWRLRREDVRGGVLHLAVRSESDRTKTGVGRDVPILTSRLKRALARVGAGKGHAEAVPGIRSEAAIRRRVEPVWREAFGTGGQLHQLRHRFASMCEAYGVPPTQIMEWLGHKHLATTQRYLHPSGTPPAGIGGFLERGRPRVGNRHNRKKGRNVG